MTYEFGPFRYDTEQRLLFRGGDLAPLAPKALETLHVLLERRGNIVEKSELMKLVWPDTNVEEVGLARNISLLRKALEDGSPDETYIETIPRRGYRFVAPVSPAASPAVEPTGDSPTSSPAPRPARRWRWIAFAAFAVAAVAFVYRQFYVPSPYLAGGNLAGLAVVPFECLSPCPNDDPFRQGLNELLAADLSKLSGVQVVSPSTVRRHQRMGISMGLMGRLLGLDMLVEGTIQYHGELPRVTARLVDVHTGRIIWAETYDWTVNDPVATPDSVAKAIALDLEKRLSAPISR